MTLQTPIRLTAAETALTEAYVRVVGDLPGDGAVASARDRLFQVLKTQGLPTRRREAWHYTDLKALLRSVPANDRNMPDVRPAIVDGSLVLPVINGSASGLAGSGAIRASAFSESLGDGSAAPGLTERERDDAIGQINGAFVTDGINLDIPAGYIAEKPVELQVLHSAGQFHSRFPASFGAGSKITIIERHANGGADAAFISTLSDIVLHDGADVTWVVLQEQGVLDTHLGQIRVRLEKDARLTLYIVNAGGQLVRHEVHVAVEGEGSDFKLRGINLLGGGSHTDVTMTLGHNVPNTTSTQIIRNVVTNRAKGVFQGQIRVAQAAQKTDARMACNTLLLSDEAEFSTKPELEIFADDVQCAHGATVTDIDHTQLFYLEARGIPESKARGLLVQAFVAEIVEELEDEALVESLETTITDWLEAHA